MRIAVVGSGIAGLSATWFLGEGHHVELFEARSSLGMDSASVDVGADRVDVPLRVFGSGYYPTLLELYADAGIPRGPADYSASYSRLGGETYFAYQSLVRQGRALSLPDPRLGRLKDNLHRLAAGARLYVEEPRRLALGRIPEVTIEQYLATRGYPKVFTEDVLWPTLSAILTCSMDKARAFPAPGVVAFFGRVLGQSFARVATGTRTVVDRLAARAAEVHLGAPVRRIREAPGGVELTLDDGPRAFDHVVLATQAHLLEGLVEDLPPLEREALARFEHTRFECLVHEDPALMPRDRRGWRPINALVRGPDEMPMYTMWMNRIVPDLASSQPVFQTINPIVEPHPSRVRARVSLDRPVLSLGTLAAVRRLRAYRDAPGRRIWLVGSYLTEGFPLLEAAVVASRAVADRICATTST